MIFIDDDDTLPFSTHSPSTPSHSQGVNILHALLENPILVSASSSLKAKPERNFSASEESTSEGSKWVYLFQREYATVDPAFVDFVGTDEATTCVGVVIRNPKNGMTSVSHMDSPKIVETGLSQMLSLLIDSSLDTELDVHLIGGFEEVSPQNDNGSVVSESDADLDGYSLPLCTKIVHTLWSREEKFHIRTTCVLGHNTKRDSEGNTYPIFNGFMELSSLHVLIEVLDAQMKLSEEYEFLLLMKIVDSSWKGKLLETYDTATDCFKIAPCSWTQRQYRIAMSLQHYSDSEILSICSTSPTAEGPDFVDNLRRQWNYLIEHPHWTETFPKKQPRIFTRSADGRWKKC